MHFELPTLPITDPVLIIAIATTIFLVLPLLFERLGLPGLIGIIVVGAVIGPNGLELLARDDTIVLLGTFGLVYLMFLMGLELDLHQFNRHRNHSVIFGVLSFLLPQVLASALALLLGYNIATSILLGATFASHTPLAYPIASRLGLIKTGAVTTVLGATLITDLLAVMVLAVVAGARDGGVGLGFWGGLLASLVLYVGLLLFVVPRIGRWFFRRAGKDGTAEFVFTIAVLFVWAYLAHVAGIEPIIGAILTGFALNRLIPEQSALMNRIKFVAEAVFVPFFLLSVGMLVDVRAFAHSDAWVAIASILAVVVVAKWLAAIVTQKLFGYEREDGLVMFGLSVSRAAATMAIAIVGYEIGLFDDAIVNATVVIILVTCLIGPWAVGRFGRVMALREERRPYHQSEAPSRILIPISNPATSGALLDLAFLVRDPSSEEPVLPIMVVRDDGDGAEAQVAEAEKILGDAVIHAASAEVSVVPLTRLDQNIATGITRGIAETRASTVVIGWEADPSPVDGVFDSVFGSVLDQLLEQTRQLVIVLKLGHPLATTRRLIVVMPPAVERHPGFFEAMRTIKVIAGQLGAPIVALVVESDPAQQQENLEGIKPDVPSTFEAVSDWGSLVPELRRRIKADDLVVVLSARPGQLHWHSKLERLPRQLAAMLRESVLIFYPGEPQVSALAARNQVVADIGPRGLSAARITSDLVNLPLDQVFRRILEDDFADDEDELSRTVEALVRSEGIVATEVRPGVVIPHTRVAGLDESRVFLGVSQQGIDFPHAEHPAKVIFLLLSPVESPQEHLRSLSEIAHLVSNQERLDHLLGAFGLDGDLGLAPPLPD